jgi:hypothetical protein
MPSFPHHIGTKTRRHYDYHLANADYNRLRITSRAHPVGEHLGCIEG